VAFFPPFSSHVSLLLLFVSSRHHHHFLSCSCSCCCCCFAVGSAIRTTHSHSLRLLRITRVSLFGRVVVVVVVLLARYLLVPFRNRFLSQQQACCMFLSACHYVMGLDLNGNGSRVYRAVHLTNEIACCSRNHPQCLRVCVPTRLSRYSHRAMLHRLMSTTMIVLPPAHYTSFS
jgi:hypothetical protein